jgi:hypothetical protein
MKKFKYWIAYNCQRIFGTILIIIFVLVEMVDVIKFPWKEASPALIYTFFLAAGLYVGSYLSIEAVKYLRKSHDEANSESKNPLKKL